MNRLRRHSRITVLAAIALSLTLIAGTAYLIGGYIVYDRATRVDAHCGGHYATNTPSSYTSDQLDTAPYLMPSYDEVSFPSRGDAGVTISGWWVPGTSASGPTVIQVHGLGSCKRSPTVLLPAGMLHHQGYNVLLIDLRNEGDSTITNGRFAGGVTECKDVLGAWDWVRTVRGIPANRIGLAGMSMGAATSIIAMGQEPAVAAVWEDSSYGNIDDAIAGELARNGYPTFLGPAGIFVARLQGLDITSLGPLDAIPKLGKRPIAIIHGAADQRIPVKQAYTLRQAVEDNGGHPYFWIVDGADHTQAVYKQPDEYQRRLAGFFGAAIGVPAAVMTRAGLLAA